MTTDMETPTDARPASWWIGLSRDALHAESEARLEGWRRQKVGWLDTLGERLMHRDTWTGVDTRRGDRG